MTADSLVEVVRGGEVESRHRVHAVVADAGRGHEARFGDPEFAAFWRSSMKPFQALPLAEDGAVDALGMDGRELAVCCASHVGTRTHLETVQGLLDRVGLGEEALACGPHRPFDGETARAALREGREFTPLHNNCSGKHAGMLALAVHHGWPPAGYPERDHPVQRRIRAGLSDWLDADPEGLAWATDGCGVPTPRLGLRQMARAFARLGRAAASDASSGARAVVDAMTTHPELVSGRGRPVTRIMEATDGRVLAKEGAEGVFCLAGPRRGWGLALKVEDGARRAATPATLSVLDALDLAPAEAIEALEDLRRPPVRNTRDEEVGELVPRLEARRETAPGP